MTKISKTIFMVQQSQNRPSRDLQKRPCIRRASSPSHSHGPLSTRTKAPALGEGGAPAASERPAFVFPPHIPHPMAAMGKFPGLEFSEADPGADDMLVKFGDTLDMVSCSLLASRLGFCSASRNSDLILTDLGPYEVRS